MPTKVPSVFLDANIVIRAGKPPGGPEIDRVGDLVDAGLVKILTTDLTVTEVAKTLRQRLRGSQRDSPASFPENR